MKRSLPQMQNVGDDDGAEKKLEKELMPTFKQLATHFAAARYSRRNVAQARH